MAWNGGSGVALVHPRLTNRGRAAINRILRTAGWKEEQFWVCRPDDVPVEARALVAMGDEAQVKLTGWSGGKRATKYTRGYELPSWTGRPVVPTLDPEMVAQGNWKLLSLMMHDVGVALGAAVGRGGVVHDPKALVDYKEGVGALRELVAAAKATPSSLIAFDLETRGSEEEDEDVTIAFSRDDEDSGESEEGTEGGDFGGSFQNDVGNGTNSGGSFTRGSLDVARASITTVQFSIAPGTGVSAEWSDEVKQLVQEIFDLPNQKISWNGWQFDEVVLRTHGINIPILSLDLMWAWHFHQPDLPAHLQGVASVYRFPFPWKHMAGSDLSFYGCCDVDVLHWIYKGLLRDMQRMGTWEGYLNYVVAFRPLLNKMEQRGIPVSREKLAELREWLQVEIKKMDERLQVVIPQEICLPEKKEPYKGIPNDVKAAIKLAHPAIVGLTKAKQGAALKTLTLDDPIVRQCIEAKGYGVREGAVWKENKQPFNPRSPLQILSYMRYQKYAIPKRFRDGADSTADKELERLEVKTGDEVIKLTRSIRAYSKMGNAYAGKIKEDGQIEGGWYPGPDGRLRSTVTYGPATGQLAARNPNCMTTPKRRAELAFKFRKCIEAEPGHKILEIDYRAFHARTLGREAQDPAYYRLADLDVHSFVAGHIVHYPGIETCLSLPDDDLRQYLGEIKKKHKAVRDFKAKPCILGIGFKMGARRLYFENRDTMTDEAEAKRLLDLIKDLFKPVFKWQDAICEEADRKHHLINAWGAIRWAWDIFSWRRVDGEWRKFSSRDAEKVVAFLPSSNAHYMLRDKLMQLNEQGLLERYEFILPIHDALLFHCPTNLIDEAAFNIKAVLEAPVKQLTDAIVAPSGFTCSSETAVGSNWANWHETENPSGMKELHL